VFETDERSSDAQTSSDIGRTATSRRAFVSAMGAASASSLAGCASLVGSGSENVLRVTAWSGNYGERFETAIKPIFESRFDATLKVNFGWEEILANIKAAPKDDPPYDVTVTAEPLYYNGRNADLFEKIRYEENVPNIDHVLPYYKDVRPYDYGAPVDGAPLTILQRTDLPKSVETWSQFDDEFLAESAGVGVDSGFWIFPLLAAGVGTDAAPGAGELYDESAHDELLDTLEEWPINGWASSGTDIWQQFDNGIIDAAQWYFGQVYYDIDDHENIQFSMPSNNAAYLNNWAVVRGTDQRTLGEKFINMLLDPEVQSEWSKESPTLFTTDEMEYAGDLGEYLPATNEEARKYAFPKWGELAPYAEKFSSKFKRMKTQG
jgi:spermidine/putrescine transport system substrate-binding protein